MPTPRRSLVSFHFSLGRRSPSRQANKPSARQANRSTVAPRRIPKTKKQLLNALNKSKEIIRISIPPTNRQKYWNLINSIKKFSRAPNTTPKQNLNRKGKNIFNSYSKLPGQSSIGLMKKLETLKQFRELIGIYSPVHANSLREGAILSGTQGIPLIGPVLRSAARSLTR
jgi:hypothetical protein